MCVYDIKSYRPTSFSSWIRSSLQILMMAGRIKQMFYLIVIATGTCINTQNICNSSLQYPSSLSAIDPTSVFVGACVQCPVLCSWNEPKDFIGLYCDFQQKKFKVLICKCHHHNRVLRSACTPSCICVLWDNHNPRISPEKQGERLVLQFSCDVPENPWIFLNMVFKILFESSGFFFRKLCVISLNLP